MVISYFVAVEGFHVSPKCVRHSLPGRVKKAPTSWAPRLTLPRHLTMSTLERSTAEHEHAPLPLPQHANLEQGYLDNGLKYIILPNNVPGGRFEAHLEVLSGSAFELERQQGMAHMLEHVVYMGSPKRQLISGTGSRTNAYTDFHHTVFFAACPTQTPDGFWKKPMLPMAFDALLDVMTTKVYRTH